MDIQLEKLRIIQKLAEVDEEWIIKSFKKLLNISDDTDDEFVKNYEAKMKPMTKEELVLRSEEALKDFKEGRFEPIENLTYPTKTGALKKPRIKELTKVEKKVLVDEICRICEKQYRKGYQHGFTHGKEGLVTEQKVFEFRLKGSAQGYRKVLHPPHFKFKENPIRRVLIELSNSDNLRNLFEEFEPNYLVEKAIP